MKLARVQKGETIFHFGDKADQFYSILTGCVQVWLPTLVEKEFTEVELINFILENKDSLLSQQELAPSSKTTRLLNMIHLLSTGKEKQC